MRFSVSQIVSISRFGITNRQLNCVQRENFSNQKIIQALTTIYEIIRLRWKSKNYAPRYKEYSFLFQMDHILFL